MQLWYGEKKGDLNNDWAIPTIVPSTYREAIKMKLGRLQNRSTDLGKGEGNDNERGGLLGV